MKLNLQRSHIRPKDIRNIRNIRNITRHLHITFNLSRRRHNKHTRPNRIRNTPYLLRIRKQIQHQRSRRINHLSNRIRNQSLQQHIGSHPFIQINSHNRLTRHNLINKRRIRHRKIHNLFHNYNPRTHTKLQIHIMRSNPTTPKGSSQNSMSTKHNLHSPTLNINCNSTRSFFSFTATKCRTGPIDQSLSYPLI